MDAGQESARLVNFVEVERRFRRSVNVDRDTWSLGALDGYIVTPAVRRALSQIADGLREEDGDRAWSLVGPYGSGKSAFAVFLADLLSPSGSPGAKAARKLLNESSDIVLPRRALCPVVLTAERAPLDMLLLKALGSTLEAIWKGRRGAKPKILKTIRHYLAGSDAGLLRCATSEVVDCFEEALRPIAATTGAGLMLLVDEAGKALEYAAQQPTRGDVYLLQALAEVAARTSRVPFVILTVLHQSFEQYAHQLGPSDRNEWSKVQGRFGELAFREGGDQMIRLTAAAIRRTTERSTLESWTRSVSAAAAWVSEGTGWDKTELAGHLDACWPLHPISAALLGPLFHSRSAQNERSLFAFLSAGEPLSFRDFLRTHGPDSLYTVDRLYAYATGMLGGRVLGRHGRWAAIESAIQRLPAESHAIDERVLKAVGLLGMLGDRVGLRASSEIVAACVDDGGAAERSLERLKQRSILVYRQFRDAFQIWEGSDLDLDDLVLRAGRQLPNDFSVAAVLQRHAPRNPLVGRRHLFQTGTLRFFDVHFVEASTLIQGGELNLGGEGDGIVLLTVPRTELEGEELRGQQGTVSPALERLGAGKPVVLVVPETSVRLSQLVQELAASQLVRTSTPELLSDPTARTELTGRIEELERQVASEVGRTFDPHRSEWLVAGERLGLSTSRAVSSVLSALCDAHFSGAPPIRNELLNRRALSTSAARARRNLMEAMILRGDVAQLGFEGNPPEVSMYRSLLEQHGFHRQRGGAWRFGPPRRALRPLWTAVQEFLRDSETCRRPLTDLYDRLRRPPFGIKDGPLPVIVVAALLARASRVAVYERGSFVPAWTPSHAERLLRSPDGFEVRQCRIDSKRREVLECLAERLLPSTARKPSLLGVVRGLVQFVANLTPYARRTLRISGRARDVRETLVRAREPAQLVFDDLPAACGCPPFGSSPKNDRHGIDDFVAALEAGLREVRDAYPALLARSAAALADHLNLPGDLAELAAELRSRASLVESAAVEPRLRSFVGAGFPRRARAGRHAGLAAHPARRQAAAGVGRCGRGPVRGAPRVRGTRVPRGRIPPGRPERTGRRTAAAQAVGGPPRASGAGTRASAPGRRRESDCSAPRSDSGHGETTPCQGCRLRQGTGARRAGARRRIVDRRRGPVATGKGRPVSQRVRHILSMSGGKDSTALAVYMRDREPDMEYVFCDTKKELQETYDYLAKVEAYLGKPIIRLNDERGFDHWLEVYGYYLPSPQMRWCTRQLKIRPFERFVGDDPVISYIGIRGDEQRDGYISSKANITPRYPFKEDGITERDVYRILDECGLGVPDYYKWRTRSGCYFCFFQRKAEWLGLKDNHPQLFQDAKAYEKTDPETGRRFTWSQNESLDELADPERVEEIRRRHLKAVEAEKASRPDRPLIEVFADSLDQEDDEQGCLVCHL